MMHPHEREEIEFRDSPVLWDATPGVCCAAFQLGACTHTEDHGEEAYEALPAEERAALDAEMADARARWAAEDAAATPEAEVPF